MGGNPRQQASGSATQSSTTSSPRAAEPTFIHDQEPEGSRKRQCYWEDSIDLEEELDSRVLLSVNTPENGKSSR